MNSLHLKAPPRHFWLYAVWEQPLPAVGPRVAGRASIGSTGVKYDSPLRYPGGKAALGPFLAETIALNGLAECRYFEPFAGGAGAALWLLRNGIVSEAHINDLDPCVAAFWKAALGEPARFSDAIMSTKLDLNEWEKQRAIYAGKDASNPFDLGFATFYLNRCNRSGVLSGAGPIGGRAQTGKWRVGARFYRESLAKRVLALGQLSDRMQISNLDARRFLKDKLPRGRGRSRVFAYLDPPYWEKGGRLYLNSYAPEHHTELAQYMERQRTLRWVMSYDDAPPIRRMYPSANIGRLSLRYNLNESREAQELLITPEHVQLPGEDRRNGAQAWLTT